MDNARQSETLTRLLPHLRHREASLAEPRIVRIDQTRSVTWLRLIRGSWLLVATSDKDASSLSLWKLSDILHGGSGVSPVSEAFLPAPVRDGAVDVTEETVTIAVSLYSQYVLLHYYFVVASSLLFRPLSSS